MRKGGTSYRDARGQIFQADILNNVRTKNDEIWKDNTRGRGASAPSPTPEGGPQRSPFLGYPYIYAYTLFTQNYQI